MRWPTRWRRWKVSESGTRYGPPSHDNVATALGLNTMESRDYVLRVTGSLIAENERLREVVDAATHTLIHQVYTNEGVEAWAESASTDPAERLLDALGKVNG